jgi:hypothetical protein
MADHNPSLFQLERLQPSWLSGQGQLWAYALVSRSLGGALLALPLAWLYRAVGLNSFILLLGLLAGALAGGVDAVALQRSPRAGNGRSRGLWRPLLRILFLVAGVVLSSSLLGSLWLRQSPTALGAAVDLRNILRATTWLAVLLAIVLGFRGARRERRDDVHAAEKLAWRREWAWRGARVGAFGGALAALGVSTVILLDPTLPTFPVLFWPLLLALLSALGALVGGAAGGVRRRPLESNVWPNQGTWWGLRNTTLLTFVFCAGATVLLFLYPVVTGETGGWRLSSTLIAGLAMGFWAGVGVGFLDFVQHWTLRTILRLRGQAPRRLVRFLDYATERGLLQRPGGSYKFFHPLLLQYFAQSARVGSTEPDRGRVGERDVLT